MKINIIAAFDPYCVMGVNGKLPFDIPEDLKRFQSLTMGHPVIMGRVTWESLPIKPLPGRRNIVISSDDDWSPCPSILYAYKVFSLNEAIRVMGKRYEEAFVIGGSRPFEEAIPLADTLYLTRVEHAVTFTATDTVSFFPIDAWRKHRVNFDLDEVLYRDGFRFETWKRKT